MKNVGKFCKSLKICKRWKFNTKKLTWGHQRISMDFNGYGRGGLLTDAVATTSEEYEIVLKWEWLISNDETVAAMARKSQMLWAYDVYEEQMGHLGDRLLFKKPVRS